MKQVFLAPISERNFEKTIAIGMKPEDVFPFLSEDERLALSTKKILWIWGNVEETSSYWRRMEAGDLVLFYHDRNFILSAHCGLKIINEKLGRFLWPDKDKNWKYIFFLDDLEKIEIPASKVTKPLGYKKDVIQGFVGLSKSTLEKFHEYFGEDFKFSTQETKDVINDIAEEIVNADNVFGDKDEQTTLAMLSTQNLNETPEIRERKIKAVKRNRKLADAVKRAYDYECQLCSFSFKKKKKGQYAELAHIREIGERLPGSDALHNMLVLCPNHHKMLDYGKWEIFERNKELFIKFADEKLERKINLKPDHLLNLNLILSNIDSDI